MFKERLNAVTKVTALEDPIIIVLPKALEKMEYYVRHCDKEIGWLGTVQKYNSQYLVKDVFLFKQQVHSDTCEITADGLSEFATELLSKPDGMDIWNSMKLWGHSHVNMGVTPSAQDNNQMKVFGENSEWFIRLIANKSGEMEFTLYDFTSNLTFENVKWMELKQHSSELEEEIKNEIKEKVSLIASIIPTGYGSTYRHGFIYDDYDYGYSKYDSKKNTKAVKAIKWVGKTIEKYFNDKELKEISMLTEIKDKLLFIDDVIDSYNLYKDVTLDITFEDSLDIITYAENKYPA